MKTADELRNKIYNIANFYADNATYEWNDRLKELIDVYNNHEPLTRNIKYKPELGGWCGLFVSAVYILAGLSDLIVTEIGAWEFKDNARKAGLWKGRDSGYIPKRGDIIVYSYPKTDEKGKVYTQYHVGICTNADANVIYTTEGNVSDRVLMLAHNPNDKTIEGYWSVDFEGYIQRLEEVQQLPPLPDQDGRYKIVGTVKDGTGSVEWEKE